MSGVIEGRITPICRHLQSILRLWSSIPLRVPSYEKKRILIVDDESLIADTLAIIFGQEGYEARAVYSAEAALQLFAQWVPQLAFIDVRLPGMNGIDLAIQVRAEYPACRISIFAGQTVPSDMLALASDEQHSFTVLEKPIQPAALLMVASQMLATAD